MTITFGSSKLQDIMIKRRREMNETIEQQEKDSQQIFKIISTADYESFEEAERAVVLFFVMDMSYSRAGISKALDMLRKHYDAR